MRGASEVITFSYGTFSCRLEGFDDPSDTMKAITTYFREFVLAAHDRGAAPACPDATRLREIAEHETHARIEVETLSDGFLLRATPLTPPLAATTELAEARESSGGTDRSRSYRTDRSADVETVALHSSAGVIHIRLGSALAAARPAIKAARDTVIGSKSANSSTEEDGIPCDRNAALTSSRSEAMRDTDSGGNNPTTGNSTYGNPTTDDDPAAVAGLHPIHTACPGDKKAPRLGDATDAAVERLIAQTNTVMEVPETRRRHSAIAHLKAAVAATKAAVSDQPRSDGRKTNPEDPYRDDLEIAVRPQRHCRRSSTAATNTATPGTEDGNPAAKNPAQEKPSLPDTSAPGDRISPLLLSSSARVLPETDANAPPLSSDGSSVMPMRPHRSNPMAASLDDTASNPADQAAKPEAAKPEAAKPDETASGSETRN